MLLKRPIRKLSTERDVGTRFCDVVVEDDKRVYLEKKANKKTERISLEELLFQVELAKKEIS